jgi:hypothetical protein
MKLRVLPKATFLLAALVPILLFVAADTPQKVDPPPTFYRDVVPILQQHCQTCHRVGEIAPFSLVSYKESKPWAQAIKKATQSRDMPPWFADPRFGKWADDPSLTQRRSRRWLSGLTRVRRQAIRAMRLRPRTGRRVGISRSLMR